MGSKTPHESQNLGLSGGKDDLPSLPARQAKLARLPGLDLSLSAESIVTRAHWQRERALRRRHADSPYESPWKALMFIAGLDFFSNGDAAVCTIHGDVWRVSGIDEKLEKLSGAVRDGALPGARLKIVNDQVYVSDATRSRGSRTWTATASGLLRKLLQRPPELRGGHDYITCSRRQDATSTSRAGRALSRLADGKKTELVATDFGIERALRRADGRSPSRRRRRVDAGSMICEVKRVATTAMRPKVTRSDRSGSIRRSRISRVHGQLDRRPGLGDEQPWALAASSCRSRSGAARCSLSFRRRSKSRRRRRPLKLAFASASCAAASAAGRPAYVAGPRAGCRPRARRVSPARPLHGRKDHLPSASISSEPARGSRSRSRSE